MSYTPIDHYGIIGNMRSAALISINGSIDWCCLPRFDSPSVFGSILDEHKGGRFQVAVKGECRLKQMYLPDTNVLVTRFLSAEGVGEVIDFMPMHNGHSEETSLVRIARCVRGKVRFFLNCNPAFNYARTTHDLRLESNFALFSTPDLQLILNSSSPLDRAAKNASNGFSFEFDLEENSETSFVLHVVDGDPKDLTFDVETFVKEALDRTVNAWKVWVAKCTYTGRWREMVIRSALILKLLVYEPTGAIIASPSCSLPEEMGGSRNWDYRYVWIRDAAFIIYAFLRLGYYEEAAQFMNWLEARTVDDHRNGPLQVLYRVDGSANVDELTLDYLDGYGGSRPVRIGNAASRQLQLDIYGELIDAIYLYNKYAQPISYELWNYVRRLTEWVCDNWERPDHSIWEVRLEPQQYVYSKLQCWVALDRALRVATKRNLPLDFDRVRKESIRIYNTLMQHGWNDKIKSFVQVLDGEALDSTSLMLPLMMFVSPAEPRMEQTLDNIVRHLVSDSLVYRYELGKAIGDGLPGYEGTFSVCTFWLVEVLARAGRLDDARFTFEKMLTYANHLGLYAEQIGPTGELLGNFPQAFTHLGLITAALDLDARLDRR